jgi:hypothetical protein
MHFLLSKLLELVRMEQEPLRVFPTAHFSVALAQSNCSQKAQQRPVRAARKDNFIWQSADLSELA